MPAITIITGSAAAPGVTSEPVSSSNVLPVGSRARDADGNEYVFCNFTASVFGRQPLQVNSDYTATPVTTTGRGAVGVSALGATSDQLGWVQIYGRAMMQIIESGVSPSDDANGPTTLGTSAQTVFWAPTSVTSPLALRWTSGNVSTSSGMRVDGMTVAQDASPSNSVSGTTAATSHSGHEVAVFLNYPRIAHVNYGE